MGRARKFGKRPTVSKATAAKVANKYKNKLVKRGKLKPKSVSQYMKARKRDKDAKASRRLNEKVIGDVERDVQAEDVMDMLSKRELQRVQDMYKRKFADDSESDEEEGLEAYESVPRGAFKNVIMDKSDKNKATAETDSVERLAKKLKIAPEDGKDDAKKVSEEVGEESKEAKPETFVSALAEREKRLEEIKEHVALLSTNVISHPEKNIKKLKELVALLDLRIDSSGFKLAFITIQKIVALAILEVFKDIIPGYRVVESFAKELDEKKRLKKETKILWDYERQLVHTYKLYVHKLERMVNCVRKKASQKTTFYTDLLNSRAAKERMAVIGATCLAELMVTQHHFNYRSNIVQMVVSLMTWEKCKEVSDIACNAVSRLYRNDKQGEVSLEAVKATAKAIKGSGFNVHPKVLFTFLNLKIKEVKKKEDKKKPNMKEVRGKLNKMSRKEKKRNKEMQKLDKQLLETDAQVNTNRRLEYHTQILNQIFLTYFRILKFNLTNAEDTAKAKFKLVLTPVLMGLSQFAHLINMEFFDDIINVLFSLMKQDVLDCHQSLHSLKTIFTIITGDGAILNIDPQRFYSQLYTTLNGITHNTDEGTVMVALDCLHLMILKQRRQITLKRVLAFIKRLATVSLQTSDATTAALLVTIKSMMQDHKQSDLLLDVDKCGSGVYLPHVEDPEFSNANSSNLWELHMLKKHINPDIGAYARYLLSNRKENHNSEKFTRKTPHEVYNSFNCETVFEEIEN